MYFNYWTDKITFKEKITKELMPLLKSFLGQPMLAGSGSLDKIKEIVADWMEDVDDVVFSCEIKIDVEKQTPKGDNTSIDVIKFIHVIPLDQ